MSTENRVTIFTKNSGPYKGIALVLDLTRQINHTYGSTVAAHPIEGSGNTVADHQYLKNIKLQIAGHISNGTRIPDLTSDFDAFEQSRQYTDAVENSLDLTTEGLTQDKEILTTVDDTNPLTEDQARVLTEGSDSGIEYSAGDLIATEDLESLKTSTAQNQDNALSTVAESKSAFIENQVEILNKEGQGSNRRIYSNNQLSKQLDALILLENIRDNRLLVDILTPLRLYEDMTINFNIPRNRRQGIALELNITCEQQRFFEAEVESVPYTNKSPSIAEKEAQDGKAKEVTAINAGVFNSALNALGVPTTSD